LRPKTFEEAGAIPSCDVLAMSPVAVGLDLLCAQLALTPRAVIPQINAAARKNLICITKI
jgi:hypothetical protein